METGGEAEAVIEAVLPRQQTQRAFRGDMDMLGCDRLDMPRHGAEAGERNPDFGIGRHWQRPEPLGREVADLVACPHQFATDAFERAHHAIDLGPPGIGDDENAARRNSDE